MFQLIIIISAKIQHALIRPFQTHPSKALFGLGMINCFLACGLVYIALSGSFLLGSTLESSLFMLLFGLGTFPSMFGVRFLKFIFKDSRFKTKLNYLVPLLSVLFGIWIIPRESNLSIPFISPPSSKLELKLNEP
ncbi:MAG: sulfite exporter TauE/SafE family protein [Flavobacteriaceae bacterium]|nr:sulfite exporter TauE/SafE family protein [Flavobacteriaceae bacterium]